MKTDIRSSSTIYGNGFAVFGLLVFMLHVASRTPGVLQNIIASSGVIPMLGVPQFCGSDARRTSPWMNPRSFNNSWIGRATVVPTVQLRVLPLFLVACGHSGTTPLVHLLSLHPNIYTLPRLLRLSIP
jgi:hypothetical protein